MSKVVPMVRKVLSVVTDDLDGSSDAETVSFSLESKTYEIDLSAANREELHRVLAPFITAGRSTGKRSGVASSRPRQRRTNLDDIRQWARDHGHSVSDRGRIAGSIVEAYEAAH